MLSKDDRNTFWFSFEEFDWGHYVENEVKDIRKYILLENESNMKKSVGQKPKVDLAYLLYGLL